MRFPFAPALTLFVFFACLCRSFAQGSVAWEKSQPLVHPETLVANAVDAAGNVFITTTESRQGVLRTRVAKYGSAEGTLIWESRHDSLAEGQELPHVLRLTPEGDVLVATSCHGSGGLPKSALTRYDRATGVVAWSKIYADGISARDDGLSLAVDSHGSIALGFTGQFNQNEGIRIARISPANGDVVWERFFPWHSAKVRSLLDLQFDPSGDLLCAGARSWTTTAGFSGMKLAGMDGTLEWQTSWPVETSRVDFGQAMTVDAGGNLVITGYTQKDNQLAMCSAKFSGSTGAPVWRTVNPAGSGTAVHVTSDTNGEIYITGQVTTPGSFRGQHYTARLKGEDGTPAWERLEPAPFLYASGLAVYRQTSGEIIAFGSTGDPAAPFSVRKLSLADGATLWERRLPDSGDSTFNHGVGAHRRMSVGPAGIAVGLDTLGTVKNALSVKLIESLSPMTLTPSALGQRSATLKATVTTTEAGVPQLDWEIGTSRRNIEPLGNSSAPNSGTGPFEFELSVEDLKPGTDYYVRTKATLNGISAFSPLVRFRTLPDAQPVITPMAIHGCIRNSGSLMWNPAPLPLIRRTDHCR